MRIPQSAEQRNRTTQAGFNSVALKRVQVLKTFFKLCGHRAQAIRGVKAKGFYHKSGRVCNSPGAFQAAGSVGPGELVRIGSKKSEEVGHGLLQSLARDDQINDAVLQ